MYLDYKQGFFVVQSYYHNVDVKQVDVPSGTGTFGILPNHVPTLAVLRPGVVTVFEDETTRKFFGRNNYLNCVWNQYLLYTTINAIIEII